MSGETAGDQAVATGTDRVSCQLLGKGALACDVGCENQAHAKHAVHWCVIQQGTYTVFCLDCQRYRLRSDVHGFTSVDC